MPLGCGAALWQKLKFSLLRPLVYSSHKKSGISPQDLKATHRGGYRKSDILEIQKNFSFDKHIYYRHSFFTYLAERFVIKTIGLNKRSNSLLNKITPQLNKIDNFMSRNLNIFRRNTLHLFWGFKK